MRAFYDPIQAAHDPSQMMRHGRIITPKDLPERTSRLRQALATLGIHTTVPERDDEAARLAVHTEGFVRYLSSAWERWQALADHGPEVLPNTFPYWSGRPEDRARPDCPAAHIIAQTGWYLGDLSVSMGPETWRSIRASANTAVAAADAVATDRGLAYALCRPSGHHARADRASGFCFLNNTAIAAERLRSTFDRVAILDVDAHHGDGTQQIFYSRSDVLTISVHADPVNYYPFFTGYGREQGMGAGAGFNLNLPLAHGSAGDAMFAAVDRAGVAIREFKADVVVVALGFDAHADDPIGVLKLASEDFAGVGTRVRALGLPTLVVQEGGYAIDAIGDCLTAFLRALG
jgi:acetoin utilization deacetylase AcuC-like enzyme